MTPRNLSSSLARRALASRSSWSPPSWSVARSTVPLTRPTVPWMSPGYQGQASLSTYRPPAVTNEPNHHYIKGSIQQQGLDNALQSFSASLPLRVPVVINGEERYASADSPQNTQFNPAHHATPVAHYATASRADVKSAVEGALAAKESWQALPFADRAAVFLKAADLISTKYRYPLMAATMLGQGKNAWQAEIDAAAELVDFLRFNVQYAADLYAHQPEHHATGIWNRLEYRPLEGFVYAVSPFNFTAIAGNLPCAPALMGNVVVWKPSDSAMASNWLLYQILREAGLPEGVIQFVPGDPVAITDEVLSHRDFAALHYTGSTAVFRQLCGAIGQGTADGRYKSYPRIVGETGGKDFHLVHRSADIDNAVLQTVRGAFEFQGQKCSATSRVYVPQSRWGEFRDRLAREVEAIRQGPPTEHANFMGPVIHKASFDKLTKVIDEAAQDPELTLVAGGAYDGSTGYFIRPTVYQTTNPHHRLLETELFGPVLVVYVYEDGASTASASASASSGVDRSFEQVCELVDTTSPYALTGSVFARDRQAIRFAEERLRNAAGNFYINCKSTGAVVGQQPFGGARASGTNDKAGSFLLASRFVSARTIKEEFVPITQVPYPSNE